MDEKQQENWLDRQLREAAPYIDDQGFTSRVLKQLPARRRRRDSLRAVILLGITFLASVLAYGLSDGGRLAFGCGIAVMAGGIFAAIFKTRELQS